VSEWIDGEIIPAAIPADGDLREVMIWTGGTNGGGKEQGGSSHHGRPFEMVSFHKNNGFNYYRNIYNAGLSGARKISQMTENSFWIQDGFILNW
jgi:hypothetical protein